MRLCLCSIVSKAAAVIVAAFSAVTVAIVVLLHCHGDHSGQEPLDIWIAACSVMSSIMLALCFELMPAICITFTQIHLASNYGLFKWAATGRQCCATMLAKCSGCAGLMRGRRIEPHPKVAAQPLAAVLQTVMPRLQDKQLKSDSIQNTENAIADLVSKGEPVAGVY